MKNVDYSWEYQKSVQLTTDLGNPEIFYNGERVDEEIVLSAEDLGTVVVLECRVGGHPIPSLSWSRNDTTTATGSQNITGFR